MISIDFLRSMLLGILLGVLILMVDLIIGRYLRLLFDRKPMSKLTVYLTVGTIFLKIPFVIAYLVLSLKTFETNPGWFAAGFIFVAFLIPPLLWISCRKTL